MFSLDFVTVEVFHPVWAFFNIKREAGHMSEPPPQASCAGQVFALSQRCTGCPCARRAPVGGYEDVKFFGSRTETHPTLTCARTRIWQFYVNRSL